MQLGKQDYAFVGIQLVLFIFYLLDFTLLNINIHETISQIGLITAIFGILIIVISLLQLNNNLSPFPTPKTGSKLIQNGVYKFVRHPIYTGIILMTFGYGLYLNSPYKVIIAIVLYILFYFKSSYEEQRLKSVFSDYENYKTKTGRFFPSLKSFLRE